MKKKMLAIILAAIMMFTVIYIADVSFKDYSSIPNKMVSGSWEKDSIGWWYKYPDGSYPTNQWLEIKGDWYYFNGSGYTEYNCYRDHYWLNSDGAYVPGYYGVWKHNTTGYWLEDGGWCPCNCWLKVNGEWYHFNTDSYLDTDTWIGNDYVDEEGKWIKGKVKPTNNGGGGTTTVGGGGNGGSGTGGSGTGNGGNGTGGNGGEKPVACSHEFVVIKENNVPVMQKQRNADGTIRLHSICNGCHRDLTVIADNKMWEQEDLGMSTDYWSKKTSIGAAQAWHFGKYGCECLGYDTSQSYDVLAPLPSIYKCSKCGVYKYVPGTGVNYYKMQHNQITDADYVINKSLDDCGYYY